MRKMPEYSVILIIGKRRTGKSTLIRDILYYKKNVKSCVIFSGTEEGNGFYGDIIPPIFIYKDFKEDVIESIFESQRKQLKKNPNKLEEIVLILDDMMYDNKFMNNKVVRELFMNGRHWHITLIIAMHYIMDIKPALRSNVDLVITTKEHILDNVIKLYKCFFGIFKNHKIFYQVLTKTTMDYHVLVLDNSKTDPNVESTVFWYKAKSTRRFHNPFPKLWKHYRHVVRKEKEYRQKNKAKLLDFKRQPPTTDKTDVVVIREGRSKRKHKSTKK